MIDIKQNEIFLYFGHFVNKQNEAHGWDCVEDVIVRNYAGQKIIFVDSDGNNANHPVLMDFVQKIKIALNLAPDQIVFNTDVFPCNGYPWEYTPNNYRIEFVNRHYSRDLNDAKFVGCLAGSRPTIMRARVIRELDRNFANDAFITCHQLAYLDMLKSYKWPNGQLMYAEEISWLKQRQFDNDVDLINSALDYTIAANAWLAIWNRYKIEVVMETVDYHNRFFTDKVAKVLMTGKPFVLLCGSQSLKRLRDFGFVTFGSWIDESYDHCVLPSQRIAAIIQALQTLYHSSKRDLAVSRMCEHAKQNIEIYQREFGTDFPNLSNNV